MFNLRAERPSLIRGILLIAVLIVVILGVAGCRVRVKPPPKVPQAIDNFFGSADNVPNPGPALDAPLQGPELVIIEDIADAPTQVAARQSMDELAASGDYEWLLVNGVCSGMESLGDYQDDNVRFSEEGWRNFLIAYFENFGEEFIPDYAGREAVDTVDGLLNTWDLSQTSPSAARWYFQACVMPR
jgi:hypothetical protein